MSRSEYQLSSPGPDPGGLYRAGTTSRPGGDTHSETESPSRPLRLPRADRSTTGYPGEPVKGQVHTPASYILCILCYETSDRPLGWIVVRTVRALLLSKTCLTVPRLPPKVAVGVTHCGWAHSDTPRIPPLHSHKYVCDYLSELPMGVPFCDSIRHGRPTARQRVRESFSAHQPFSFRRSGSPDNGWAHNV